MSISISWFDPDHRILWVKFRDVWGMTEYHTTIDGITVVLGAEAHIVHVIYDFQNSSSSPPNLMAAGYYAEKHLPANQGISIFLKPGVMVQIYLKVWRRLNMKMAQHAYLADTVEQAFQIIDENAGSIKG